MVFVGVSVSCASLTNPEIWRIPGAFTVTSLEALPLMTWCNASNTMHYLYSNAAGWQTPFWQWRTGWYVPTEKNAVWKPWRGRTEVSSKVRVSASAPGLQRLEEEDPLWNRAHINVPAVLPGDICVLWIAEVKKASLYVSEMNRCHCKSRSPVKGKLSWASAFTFCSLPGV